jgi:hypothetical protein
MHEQFQSVNPFREPSWRFQRVLDLVERDRPGRCTSRDDEYVKAYRRFAGKFRGARSEENRISLFPDHPGLFIANLIHHQPDKEWRWLLQARILSGEGDKKIASRMSTLPSAVDWYEKIFFNVRDRLEAEDYIAKHAIGKLEDRGPSAREGRQTDFQEQMSYKLFGYYGGPYLLDIMFSGFLKVPRPDRPERVDQWMDGTMQTLVRRKALSAARHLDINKFNVMQLLEIQLRIIEAAKDSGGSATEYERNIQAVMDDIPWELSEARSKRLERAADMGDFAETAVEPRADELLQMSMGQVPRKLLKDRKLRIVPAGTAAAKKESPK